MIELLFPEGNWLPTVFGFLMGLSMLIYAVLDGYDLGVGMLMDSASWQEKDRMVASIGPFWDANETWLVLGVGILLVAFPMAHGAILTALYIPVAMMLIGLILRGVAFDFRAKVPYQKKWRWNLTFFLGSLLAALSQGYMLGSYITGFSHELGAILFSVLTALSVAAGYCLIGACWLIWKCEGILQRKAVRWARYHLINTCIGIALVSIATPLMSERIFDKWFTFPNWAFMSPIPLLTGGIVLLLFWHLRRMPYENDRLSWLPLVLTALVYVLCFCGLGYSFFPYIIPEQMTLIEAASAPESLFIIFVGAMIVLPVLIGYTILAYWIFRGKATDLRYD